MTHVIPSEGFMGGGIGVTPKSTNEFFEMIFIWVLFGSHKKKMFTCGIKIDNSQNPRIYPTDSFFNHLWSPSKRHNRVKVCFCKQPIYQKLQFCRIQSHEYMIPSQKWASPAMPLGSWKQPASTTMDAADGSCSPSFVGFEISKTWTPFSSSSVLK